MPRSERARSFCLTWNNPGDDAETLLRSTLDRNASYAIVGREIGEEGTPHLQCYVQFKNARSFASVKASFPKCHIEKAMGSGVQNFEYCSKDGDFWEIGQRPRSKADASRETWSTILAMAKAGHTEWIEANHPRVWIHFSTKLCSLRSTKGNVLDGELEHEWWVGPTGCGKSKSAWGFYEGSHYQKEINKWWDGYAGEDLVVIEEWSPGNSMTAQSLKVWADRYPFTGQIKGGTLQKIRPKKIIVLSNYEIGHCFPEPRDHEPLERRFKTLRFPEDLPEAKTRAQEFMDRRTPGEPEADAVSTAETMDIDEEAAAMVMPTPADLELESLFPNGNWTDYADPADFNRMLSMWSPGS